MTYEESIEQLKSLIEHFNNGGNDFNATDIEAIKYLLKENQNLRADYGNKSQVERDLLYMENEELKKQLEYLRSNEYLNQLRFERDVLQYIVDKGEVSKEDRNFIDCTHRNTELLEENQKLKKQLEEKKNKYIKKVNKILAEDIEPDPEDFYLAEIEGKSNDYDKLLNQQKEFIKYLKDKINELIKEYGNYVYDDYSEEKGKYDTCIEILQKYKEIIGDDK